MDLEKKMKKSMSKFQGYRLADVFIVPRWKDWKLPLNVAQYTYKKWPYSIAGEYAKRVRFKSFLQVCKVTCCKKKHLEYKKC